MNILKDPHFSLGFSSFDLQQVLPLQIELEQVKR